MDTFSLTSIKKRNLHYFKREDEFVINGVCGGKARVVYELVKQGVNDGLKEFVTCGSRDSRQCEVVAKICEYFGVKSHLFMPNGKETDVLMSIYGTQGAELYRTKVGYNSVIMAYSKAYANENNFGYIPFGLECQASIDINMHQVENIPSDVKRIVIPCGGGMNMISVIKGLDYYGRHDIEVVGVVVGKKPDNTFNKFLGRTIFDTPQVKWRFERYPFDYHTKAKNTEIDGVVLDSVYEAKCIPFLQDNDLMWIVGRKM